MIQKPGLRRKRKIFESMKNMREYNNYVSSFSKQNLSQIRTMKKVTGVGGIFFKCKDPKQMREWYSKHLGLNTDEYGTSFETRHAGDTSRKSFLQWSPFADNTKYFD